MISTPPGRCGNFSKNTQCLRPTCDSLGALGTLSTSLSSGRMNGEKALTDEGILGTDDFVEGMLGDADRRARRSFPSWLRDREVQQLIVEGDLVEFLYLLILDSQSPGRTGRQPRPRPIILSYPHYQNPPHLTRNGGNLNQRAQSGPFLPLQLQGAYFHLRSPLVPHSTDAYSIPSSLFKATKTSTGSAIAIT